MPRARAHYPKAPEALLVRLARERDRDAFAELVRRRQGWIRTLMRPCCGDATLADDLAQQAFLQAWRKLAGLRQPDAFAAWLRRLAVTTWLQQLPVKDALHAADPYNENDPAPAAMPGAGRDLARALASLEDIVRACVVLSYHDGLTHGEIAAVTDLPLGTMKSHIRRGTQRLQQHLSAYRDAPGPEAL